MRYRVRNIGIAVLLAALAALITTLYVTNYKHRVQRDEKNVDVLVAARDIAAGTPGSQVVADRMLATRSVARRAVVPGAVSSPGQIAQLVATQAVYAGEQVTTRRFGPASEGGIRTQLKGTMRALAVPGDRNQLLAGTLKAGDHVDIVASIKYKVSDLSAGGAASGADQDRVASRVVLRNIDVLEAASAPAVDAKIGGSAADNLSVILAVTDSQAQKLFFVMRNGDWSLQLRPVLDASDSPDSVETVASVLGDGVRAPRLQTSYPGGGLR